MKKCSKCGLEKPLSEFYTDPSKKDGHSYNCKECRKAQMRERSQRPDKAAEARERSRAWYEANKERAREYAKTQYTPENNLARALKRYGMTPYEYSLLLEAQEGKCAICGVAHGNKNGERLVIDHCHDTGAVRGLLCHSCNRGLGMLRDSAVLLQAALNYLKETQNV